ncbi:hypothetical protein BAY61_10775 [Prauserella marina]|uniref:Uncharacterized protein n=2 Tax=Prauserella marina TaxID=530584 RepID=A0A222VNV3_9PSEU|nr:hypothetical protein BAY61_10775 [Prauserella marina]PWV84797.1 hypothetical protein DES30_101815 [Prauserella marina]SDC12916.1 hypothetical protein SAMN05421630_101521 [Prauserella marina]
MGTMSWGIDAVMAEARYRAEELHKTRGRTSLSARSRRERAEVPAAVPGSDASVTEIAGRARGGFGARAARVSEEAPRRAS